MNSTYYRLLDAERKGMIVRADSDAKQYRFTPGRGWVPSAVMLHYFSPESPTYNMYEEISESEALKLIG